MTTSLLDGQIAVSDFRMLVAGDNSIRTLNQKRLDVSTGATSPAGFLFAATLIALRSKTSLRAEIFSRWKH